MRAWTTPASTSLHSLQLLHGPPHLPVKHVWLRLSQQRQCRSTRGMVTRSPTPALSQQVKKMTSSLAQCRRVRFFSCPRPVLPCRRMSQWVLGIGKTGCTSFAMVCIYPTAAFCLLDPRAYTQTPSGRGAGALDSKGTFWVGSIVCTTNKHRNHCLHNNDLSNTG